MDRMYNTYEDKIKEIKNKHKRDLQAAEDYGLLKGLVVSFVLVGFFTLLVFYF